METDNCTGGSSLVIGLTISPRTALIIKAVLNFPWIVTLAAVFTGFAPPMLFGALVTVGLFALALESLLDYATNPNRWSKVALYVCAGFAGLSLVAVPFVTALDMAMKGFV